MKEKVQSYSKIPIVIKLTYRQNKLFDSGTYIKKTQYKVFEHKIYLSRFFTQYESNKIAIYEYA